MSVLKSSVTDAVFKNNSGKQDSLTCNLFCSHVLHDYCIMCATVIVQQQY